MKYIILIALTLTVSVCFAQESVKKDTVKKQPVKLHYEYFVKVPANIYYQVVNTVHSYRDILIYDPNTDSNSKLNNQAAIDKAMVQLRALPVDSAVVKK
ncbi:hypothetical protein [Mucilaginibacter sp. L3T2-6]|uniref:hypothetical protein n=1 Tax=Mucilaginibacter sp. L3T2-6 TaxID=3062491 RepID=UPI002677624A|nr:hypothetical protein [Mucilaginibacter sp. L3T2-6]MDO3641984.1 hypothetical protein [Mucilaginibacter sp. L3T2-6]MDV6214338.1 hypothetical protein [Mucilaginibacter sp. L3T2-6]